MGGMGAEGHALSAVEASTTIGEDLPTTRPGTLAAATGGERLGDLRAELARIEERRSTVARQLAELERAAEEAGSPIRTPAAVVEAEAVAAAARRSAGR